MKRKIILLACLIFVVFAPARAQKHAIELKTDKKIIYPELLGYNDNTALEDILQVLPELINRSTGSVIANFSVQLDGKDVGEAKDVVLKQTHLVEIDCIEVSTSPTASEQSKGQGGTINVKLRAPEQGTHGMAQLGASTMWAVQPAVYLRHKSNQLELRSAVLLEYFAPSLPVRRESLRKSTPESPHRTLYLENENRRTQGLGETAKLDLTYHINDRNHLRFWAIETGNFSHVNADVTAESHTPIQGDTILQLRLGQNRQISDQRNIRLNALTEYKHQYASGGELVIEAGYNYQPNYQLTHDRPEGAYYNNTDARNQYSHSIKNIHEISGKIKSKQPLPLPHPDHRLDMEVGINATYGDNRSAYTDSVWNFRLVPMRQDTRFNARKTYVSPYLEWEYTWKDLTAKAGVRYQFTHRDMDYTLPDDLDLVLIDQSLQRQKNNIHDVTANLFVSYAIHPQHRLRLMWARNLIGPSDWQSYTGSVIHWGNMTAYTRDHVRNAHTYNLEVDYIFDWAKGDHNLIFDCGLRYIHSDDLIEEHKTRLDSMPEIQLIEIRNGGTSDLGMIDLSLCYRYHGFSFAFAANTFFSKDRFYYNLSLSPIYAFPREWYLAGRFAYYSRVKSSQSYIGDCFYAQLRLHKNIRRWTIYMEMDDIFDYMTEDKTIYPDNGYSLTQYDLYKRALALGFSYKF